MFKFYFSFEGWEKRKTIFQQRNSRNIAGIHSRMISVVQWSNSSEFFPEIWYPLTGLLQTVHRAASPRVLVNDALPTRCWGMVFPQGFMKPTPSWTLFPLAPTFNRPTSIQQYLLCDLQIQPSLSSNSQPVPTCSPRPTQTNVAEKLWCGRLPCQSMKKMQKQDLTVRTILMTEDHLFILKVSSGLFGQRLHFMNCLFIIPWKWAETLQS